MISEVVLYRWFGLLLVVGSLVLLGLARRLPSDIRIYGYIPAVASVGMGTSYLLMSLEFLMIEVDAGVETSGARFIGYTVMWLAFAYVLKQSAGVDRRMFGMLVVALLWANWSTLGGWLTDGIVQLAVMASMVLMIGVTIYLLTGRFKAAAARRANERRLLYTKTMYLTILTWVVMLLSGVLAEYNLEVTDTFVGSGVAIYADVVLILGFVVVIYGGREGLEQIADDPSGGESPDRRGGGRQDIVGS